MLKLKDVTVHVHYMEGLYPDLAWDKLILGHGETSKKIQMVIDGAFKVFDVVIIQKIQHQEALTYIQNMQEKYPDTIMIAEVDDSVGHVDPSNPQYLKFAQHHKWAAQHCMMADGVIASTEYLGESLKKFNENVYVAPNCIQTDSWNTGEAQYDPSNPRIGYVAGGGHDKDLKIAYKAILPVLEENPHVTFVIRYGGLRPKFLKRHKQIDFKRVSWPISKYPEKLGGLGISLGLAPLRDTEFNRCKSNLKWLEWSSLGVPTLATNMEPYSKTKGPIRTVENDVEEWNKYLTLLAPTLQAKPNEELIESCLDNYNITTETKNLVEWLKICVAKTGK